ncbi:hypothetical protein RJ639_046918 [Escallonia herrerae]|uniref:Drought induced 19 protein type zinc-binding domain-containing protein n=1 Tax=Escallonia herrerae TaxID=1293975 RepID=A0AA88W6A4_9ASTE|nr:hypothetical protein RJ639_046918 [Escallonia herrerae]
MRYDPTLDLGVSCTDGDDDYVDVEEVEEYEELKSDLTCPFCFDGFDTIGWFCHIDAMHPARTKSGICPLCDTNTGTNMSAHIIKQHEMLKYGHSHPLAFRSDIRCETDTKRDGYQQKLARGSSSIVSSSNIAPDSLLSLFVHDLPLADEPEIVQPSSFAGTSASGKSSGGSALERYKQLFALDRIEQQSFAPSIDRKAHD